MKQFKKILSTGLALMQVCMGPCVLGNEGHGNDCKIICNIVPASQTKNSWEFKQILELTVLASFAAMQVGCAKNPGLALKLAEYGGKVDLEELASIGPRNTRRYDSTENIEFSECVSTTADLRQVEVLLKSGKPISEINQYIHGHMRVAKLTGGLMQAIKLQSLGFAKDIYVVFSKKGMGLDFYYIPGMPAVCTCSYLQHLIDLVNTKEEAKETAKNLLIGRLKEYKNLLERSVSYSVWTKSDALAEIVKDKLPFGGSDTNEKLQSGKSAEIVKNEFLFNKSDTDDEN